ncbi:hypothetical protein PG988_012504 [Apiospora saccharicola]
MPKKTSKSDEKEYHIEEQEQDPTEDISEDGDDDHGSASHDPLYELSKKVAAHAGRKEVQEEDYEVLRKVYGCYQRIQGI